MTSITVQSPRHISSPRGAVLAAWIFGAVGDACSRWIAASQLRSERREITARLGDAASVRRYAQAVAQYDARFAADLFAAADRHEQCRM